MAVAVYPVAFFVLFSLGVHALIAVVMGDICAELDLLLHTPRGKTVSMPFLPNDPPVLPCGGGGTGSDSFGSLGDELLRQMQPALDFVGHQLLQACNSEDEFEGFQFASMNCTGLVGPGGLLKGVAGVDRRGPPYRAGRYSIENIERALVDITLGDPGIRLDENGQDEQAGFCVVRAEEEQVAASDAFATCGLEEAAVTTCQPPVAWLNAASRGQQQEQQALETRRTLLDCGSIGPTGCKLPLLQSLACRIVSEKNVMLKRARALSQLNELTIEPLARCEFARDIFSPIFMAGCVDALGGLSLIDSATKLCGATLLLMIPFTVCSSKRFDGQNQRGVVGKISPIGDDRLSAPVDNNLLDFSADGGALVVRPPVTEGERTLLLNGKHMCQGRHFCEFSLLKSKLGDHIVGLARPDFKPSGSGGAASASASVKKGKGLGWGIRTHSGAIVHAGRAKSWEGQKKMPQGSRIGLLLDLSEGEGSLTCYLNGQKLGSVIPAGTDGSLSGPLVWMVELVSEGDAIRIEKVPAPVGVPERFPREP